MARMMIVSDSLDAYAQLARQLERLGHRVATADSWLRARAEAREQAFSVLVIDTRLLAADDGRETDRLMRWVRPGCSVLAVDRNGDRQVSALQFARIADALSRAPGLTETARSRHDYGFMTVDIHRREVEIQEARIALTPIETHILSILASNTGDYIRATRLVDHVYGYRTDEREAADIIRVHIHNLRQKLGRAGVTNPRITCGRGKGYMLERRPQPELAFAEAAVAAH